MKKVPVKIMCLGLPGIKETLREAWRRFGFNREGVGALPALAHSPSARLGRCGVPPAGLQGLELVELALLWNARGVEKGENASMLGQEACEHASSPAVLTLCEEPAPLWTLEHNKQRPSVRGVHVHSTQERSCFIPSAAKQYEIRGQNLINSESCRR